MSAETEVEGWVVVEWEPGSKTLGDCQQRGLNESMCGEPASVQIDGVNFCHRCADDFANRRLHETKDEFEDGPMGLMPLAIFLSVVGICIVVCVVWYSRASL